jgi:hypothetical protein
VLDDVGCSAVSCYGGPIETPHIDRIAAEEEIRASLEASGLEMIGTYKRSKIPVECLCGPLSSLRLVFAG